MIITITLNPAVDRTIILNELVPGQVNRVLDNRQDAGGKGIELEIYRITGETRQNMKIVDQTHHQYTDINEAGPEIDRASAAAIKEAIVGQLQAGTVLVLSGSAAPGFEPTIYAELVREARQQGCKVILDADDQLLKEALPEAPWLVKPNIHELEALAGYPLDTHQKVKTVADTILNQGVQVVVVSMGKDGALWFDQSQAFHVKSLSVPVRSTVGAGDAMVAALAVALDQGIDAETAMRLATVSSAASVMAEGSDSGNPQGMKEKMDSVCIEPLREE